MLRLLTTKMWNRIGNPAVALIVLITSFACTNREDYQKSYSHKVVQVNPTIEKDSVMLQMIEPFRLHLDSIMSEVIGYAKHDLLVDRKYESTLGTFVSQLLLSQSIATFGTKVDAVIINHGGLRAPINKGAVTLGDVYQVMPFENELVLLEMSGKELLKVVKHIGESGHSMIWPFSFSINASYISDIKLGEREIDSDAKYLIATSDYLANGGDNFYMLKTQKRMDITVVKIRDMIEQEIRNLTLEGDSITCQVGNLIKRVNK